MSEMRCIWKNMMFALSVLVILVFSNINVNATQMTSEDSAVINVESYEVEAGILNPGEQITIKLVIKNNSKVTSAKNIVITFDSANYALLPIYGEDNQVYIDEIAPNAVEEIVMKAVVNSAFNMDMAQLQCNFNYISGRVALANSSTLYIPKYVSDVLIAEATTVVDKATVGVKSLVSVKYKNASMTDINNAKLVISGNIEEAGKEIELPIIAAGKRNAEDYYVIFTESGIQKLQIHYLYEDATGTEYIVDCGDYVVNVVDDARNMGTDAVVEQESEDGSMIGKVLVLLVAMFLASGIVVVYIKKRR